MLIDFNLENGIFKLIKYNGLDQNTSIKQKAKDLVDTFP